MEITYTKRGDYYYPDLALPPQPTEDIGRFGRMRKKADDTDKKVVVKSSATSASPT